MVEPTVRHMPGHTTPTHASVSTPAHRAVVTPVQRTVVVPAHTGTVTRAPVASHVVTHQRVAPQHVDTRRPVIVQPVAQTNYRQTTTQPRYAQHQGYQHQHRPSATDGLFPGLLFGGMLGSQRQSYPTQADYRQSPDQYGGIGTGEPLLPAIFQSLMNAAIEGRPETRVRMNNSEVVPTTQEERMMFTQLMYNILQRPGQPINENDERALFTPEALANRNTPGARPLGTHITHFSDDFTNPALGQMVDRNYDLLINQYASEYQQYRSDMAQQGAPRQQLASTGFPGMPGMSGMTGITRLFGI